MTMLPASTDFTGATITEGQFKTAITSLRAFLFEKLGDDGSVAIQAFASGTRMLFQQTASPTGWTKQTTHNDKALRVVSGTVSSGGTSAFSTVFGKTATDAFTLTTAHMPSHSHSLGASGSVGSYSAGYVSGLSEWLSWVPTNNPAGPSVSSSGSGGAHSHGMDIRVQYVDIIIAAKD